MTAGTLSTAKKVLHDQQQPSSTDSESDFNNEEGGGENARLLWLPISAKAKTGLFSASFAKDIGHQQSRSGTCRAMAAALVAVGWMCVSSLLILVNKHILTNLEFR
jgi:hypothetical protein